MKQASKNAGTKLQVQRAVQETNQRVNELKYEFN